MKLHLTKGLMMALIVAAGQVMAADLVDLGTVTNANVSGVVTEVADYDISNFTWDGTNENNGKIYLGYGNKELYGDYGLYVADEKTATVMGIYVRNSQSTVSKLGGGTLEFKNAKSSDSECDFPTAFDVEAGTLKFSAANHGGLKNSSVTVQSGATLELAADQQLGGKDESQNDFDASITLKNGGTLLGTGTLSMKDSVIKAEGTGNTVSVDIKSNWDINFDVAQGGELTISGAVEDGGSDNVKKRGAGTLIFSNTATIDDTLTLDVEAGALDLSDVSTFAAGLKLANNTTLILDGTPVSLSGALTMGSGITVDLGDTAMTYGMTIFTSTSTFSDALDGLQVAIKAANGYVQPAGYIVLSEDKTAMKLIPEPTTATLSLLALAGLAARRRRK